MTAEPLDFVVDGDGPGVLLIHGTGADAQSNWGELIDSLAYRHRVVAANLPGAGATPPDPQPLDSLGLADRLVDTADAANIGSSFDVVGHSLGSVLALAVAARVPERVRSLAVHAGWARSQARERLMFDTWGLLLRTDAALLARTLVLGAMSEQLLARIDQRGLDELVAGFAANLDARIAGQITLDAHVDIHDAVPAVRAPTLVLASADDRVIPTRHQRALADAITGARYKEIPGGHGLPFEDPATLFAEVDAWLATPRASTAAHESAAPAENTIRTAVRR